MKFYFFLILFLSSSVYANYDKWYGRYHYFSSEEISSGNIATKEVELFLTSNECQFSIVGFQIDKKYICEIKEQEDKIYIMDKNSKKRLGVVVFNLGNYYLYSDDVLDLKDNLFYKD
ncbi:hypothetical protein BJD20_01625 [Acinetobacter proteolyticus]|jgi:hypothetical protein|uniref:DUF5991 domain-containing protein n=1 Tax=Acinetobacter proteolyticus TaxID=1776741 RepID=UPI0008634C0C|nr:DUF5991 domain-containing protein [Acinetobacter proteolyticus]OEY96742.1 hypothetical protein BJD20_01625 [Acinetobacter proteolyticus]